MIEPNRLSTPGEAAARQRVEVVFEAIDRLAPSVLAEAAIGRTDPDERDRLLDVLDAAVIRSGREELLDEAREPLNGALQAKVAKSLLGAAYGALLVSSGNVDDRVAAFQAIDDAVCVAVAEDLLALDDARALSDPGRALLGLPPVGDVDTESSELVRGPYPWEPTDTDWAEAQGVAGIDPDAPLPGGRGLRLILFGAIAVFGIPIAIGAGLAEGQPLLGVLVALAIGALCWTFATFRRAR